MEPTTHHLWWEIAQEGDVTAVRFTRSSLLEESTIRMLEADLFALVDRAGRRKLLLNFDGVTNVSSHILSMLVRLERRLKLNQGRLALCAL